MPRQSVFDMSYGNPNASTVLIQMVDDHDLAGIESEAAEIKRQTDADFYLVTIKVQNWNVDLSPWPAPAVFGKEGFGNGAADTLDEVLKICTDQEKTYFIGGYSLAGLFALWAAYQTDVFNTVYTMISSKLNSGRSSNQIENILNYINENYNQSRINCNISRTQRMTPPLRSIRRYEPAGISTGQSKLSFIIG